MWSAIAKAPERPSFNAEGAEVARGRAITRDRRETGLRPPRSEYNLRQVILSARVVRMNFNLYIDDQTAKELDRTARKLGETRSGLIRKALREWLDKKTLGSPGWPSPILEWQGVSDMPAFESYRSELLPPGEDSFS
jgi:hypothetical protein